MSGSTSERWVLAGGFAVAAAYGVVALVEVIVSTDAAGAIPFACIAVTIAAPLIVVSQLLDSPRQDEPGGEGLPGDDNGSGPSGGGGDDPTSPSGWSEFEREFRAYADRRGARSASRTPVP